MFQHHQQRRLFEVHAEAEERFFYPEVLKIGRGAGGADSAADETEDAIGDHNDIRDAVERANGADVGSEDLADFRQHADLQTRHDIAVKFLVFEAQHATGIEPTNRDPEDYVAEGTPSST